MEKRKTSIILTGIILELLRNYFKQNDSPKYTNDRIHSEIDIQAAYRWTPDVTQVRPGIYVKREEITIGARRGMSDIMVEAGPSGETIYNFTYNCRWSIFCISPEVGTVEELGMTVSELLIAYAPIIKKDFNFERFNVRSIGAVGKVEEAKDFWMVPIQVDGTSNESWPLQPQALPITDIQFNDTYNIG